MNKLIPAFATLALLSSTASAAKIKKLDLLMYLAPQGGFLSETTLRYGMDMYEVDSPLVNDNKEISDSQLIIEEKFSYGATNNLTLSATLGYLALGTKTTTTSGSDADSDYSGLTDMEFEGRYRLYNRKSFAGNLDLIANFSPSFDGVDSGQDGNATRGGHTLSIGSEFGNNSYIVGLNFDFNMEQSQETNDVEIATYSSRLDFQLYGIKQFTMSGNHSFDLGVGLDFLGAYDSVDTSGVTQASYDSAIDLKITSKFNYFLDKHMMITPFLDFTYGMDYDVTALNTETVTSRMKFDVGATFKYYF